MEHIRHIIETQRELDEEGRRGYRDLRKGVRPDV